MKIFPSSPSIQGPKNRHKAPTFQHASRGNLWSPVRAWLRLYQCKADIVKPGSISCDIQSLSAFLLTISSLHSRKMRSHREFSNWQASVIYPLKWRHRKPLLTLHGATIASISAMCGLTLINTPAACGAEAAAFTRNTLKSNAASTPACC
jgi:hypothetical protein